MTEPAKTEDKRPPAIRCPRCNRVVFLNLLGKLVHWDSETYSCPERPRKATA